MDINYKDCDYKELLNIISNCRKELEFRGTVTEFCTVNCKTKKKTFKQLNK